VKAVFTDTPATTPQTTRSILLITLSNVGDAVMTTPVMTALHDKYPLADMDIVTDARAAPLFSHCPWLGDIILKDKQAGWRGLVELLQRLRQTRYDLLVDLRTDGLSLLLRARRRLTRRGSRSLSGHAVERHFSVIREREHLSEIPAPSVWLSAAEEDFAAQALARLPGSRWLALGPGARWEGKCWPAGHFAALANRLQGEIDAVILLGSAAERDRCVGIEADLAGPCLNLAGRTDLLQATAVLQQAQLFIGNDSGLGHMAAAAGTPTVTIFGPGDPQRYHPWHPRARWIQSMTGSGVDVSVDAVAGQVMALLAQQSNDKKTLIDKQPIATESTEKH
jgi:ADP-heptose:LPS heptosyltransferase